MRLLMKRAVIDVGGQVSYHHPVPTAHKPSPRQSYRVPRRPPPNSKLLIILAVVAFFIFLIPALASLYVDAHWFASVGHGILFSRVIEMRLLVGAAAGLFTFLLLFVNLRVVSNVTEGLPQVNFGDPNAGVSIDLGQLLQRIAGFASAGLALLVGLSASQFWSQLLLYRHGVSFGQTDPLFGRDASFFVFELPAFEALRGLASMLAFLCLAAVALAYFIRGAILFGPQGLSVRPEARKHLSYLAAFLLLVLAFGAWVDSFGISYSTMGPVEGASYVDVHVRLVAYRILIATCVVGAVLVVLWGKQGQRKLLVIAVAGYFVVQFVGLALLPGIVHKYMVVPNEGQLELPYIARNIDATRFAFALEDVQERDLAAQAELSRQDIEENGGTIDNIRIWDHKPLLDTFAEIQEIRTYYEFVSVDNDRYMIDGELRQVMLSPREIQVGSLPEQAQTWPNKHFTYTHGFGLTLGPVNRATKQGLPALFVKDIPPDADYPSLAVQRPAIYFGEVPSMNEDYVFVNTDRKEFDYPSTRGDDVFGEYAGKAGVPLKSFVMRAALAIRAGSVNILMADDLRDDSRVVLHRNIMARVLELAPFLTFDRDPYMVLRDNGQLVWVLDAYTTSKRYPYAQRATRDVNYVRNSVKVLIDAYDGVPKFYVSDPDDPIIQTWEKIFPGSFKPLSFMPADVRAHLRYPEMLFSLQSQMLAVYHMDEADQLYNREDEWELPKVSPQSERRMEPYYTVMKLPGETQVEFIQMLPFTPKGKNNLAAWLVSRMDGRNYGEKIVYRFPKDRLVFGPEQVMNRINQDAEISRQITLWNDANSETELGTLLVVPIEQSLIYVCPLYIRAKGGRLPELKRVIVNYENSIVMADTLDLALQELFPPDESQGEEAAAPAKPEDASAVAGKEEAKEGQASAPTKPADKAQEARKTALREYNAAVSAQRKGDWAAYGEHLDKLGKALRQLSK